MATSESPMPMTAACNAIRRERRAIRIASAEPVDPVDGEHDVGGLGGRGRTAGADRHPDAGRGQRGRVVHAVTDHDRRPVRGLGEHPRDLARRVGVGADAVDADQTARPIRRCRPGRRSAARSG